MDPAIGDRVHFAGDALDAATGADVLVIATEWNEFRSLDLDRLRGVMRTPVIVDLRNVLDPERARAAGFTYVGTGRGVSAPQTVAAVGQGFSPAAIG
jgi:UDPglucose 6-dehydrogenase